MKPDWFPEWSGETCVIVASGPSAKDAPLETARGKARFIAINRSWELAPWADVLYCCDFNYYRLTVGLPQFTGLKLTGEKREQMEPWGIHHVEIVRHAETLQLAKPGTVGSGGNSGFQALNLAIQLGVKKILLVGYDMRIDLGSHWHGPHPKGMNNPGHNVKRWRRAVDSAAEQIAKLGVTVINTSETSALKNYPKMNFGAALS